MNKIEVIGNLGQDAEIKDFNGRRFVAFTVADSYNTKDQNGNTINHCTWFSCTMNGEGGNLLQYLKKGTPVFVRGNLKAQTYNRRDGGVGIDLSVSVGEITFFHQRNLMIRPADHRTKVIDHSDDQE